MADWLQYLILGAFSVMMLSWNFFLMRQNQVLTNKLMSRNYGDYATAERYIKDEPEEVEKPEVQDPYDAQRARELNGAMGLG